MRLWTWQSKDFSLADKRKKIERLKHSCYLKNLNQNKREKHREAYEKVFQKLGDQLIWCFTDYRDATSEGSIEEFENLCHCLLWELDMPEEKIIWYCDAAWETIRTGSPKMTAGIWEIFHSYEGDLPEEAKKYENEFNKFWSGKATEELLHLMFLKKPVYLGLPNEKTLRCSEGAIVLHPVDKNSIKKNPKEKEFDKWWKSSEGKNWSSLINDENLLKMIPCHNCPGR